MFRVTKVTKQKSKGLGNASFLYQIERTNGDPVKGSYRREELQIVPSMKNEWNPGVSKGRDYTSTIIVSSIDKLRTEGTISNWDAKHNRFVRDGSTWAEQEIDKLDHAECIRIARVLPSRPASHCSQGDCDGTAARRRRRRCDSTEEERLLEDSLAPSRHRGPHWSARCQLAGRRSQGMARVVAA